MRADDETSFALVSASLRLVNTSFSIDSTEIFSASYGAVEASSRQAEHVTNLGPAESPDAQIRAGAAVSRALVVVDDAIAPPRQAISITG